jgi:hypothetical protein
MTDESHNPGSQPNRPSMSETVRGVVRLAALARALRVTGAVSSLVVLVVACVAGAAAVDAAVRFPAALRGVILGGIAFAVVVDLRRFVLPALRFRPQPVELALRIERMRPELAGKLASAVEFEMSGAARGSALAARAVRDAEERSAGAALGRVMRLKPTALRACAALGCVVAVVAFAVVEPSSASIAARRVLAPWSDAVWPARTALEALVADGSVAARGRPLALRARMTQGESARERVRAEYRFTRDGTAGEWIEVALARQPSGVFERFVDAEGDAVEVRFLTSDAATDVAKVRLVAPPAVTSLRARIEPPAYAAVAVAAREIDLGDGGDSRGIMRDPVLEGSALRVDIRLSREVPVVAGASADGPRPSVMVTSAGTRDDDAADARARAMDVAVDPADPTLWTVTCEAQAPTRISIQLVDADGIDADDETVLAFDTIADRAPTATVAEPLQDESVVADARIAMRAESRDDLALIRAGMEIATRIGKDGAESLVFEEPASIDGVPTERTIERTLELARLKLSAGDSVVLRAYAEDALASHGRVRSAPRVLRIVGEEEFERQIRGVFAGVRRDAMRVDERQGKARDALERDPAERGLGEMQAAVTDGATRMREAIEQAMERLERNGRAEGVLSELAGQARELAGAAEARSAEANEAIEQAQAEPDATRREAAMKDAAARQEAVREELEDLVGLLDRDQDAWVAKRRLEALANRIRQSARETDQAARRSNGETREQLSPDARAEIDALAERQQQSADEAEQVAEALRDRAEELKEADPQQARALEEAAQAMEDGKVREEMEQAAKDAGRNRLAQSKEAQDRAAAALQKAGAALSEDRKVRAEELARELESLADSIRRLIAQAEDVRDEVALVDATAEAADARERAALGAGKLSQNTRGVAGDARASGREAARVARTLDGAAASLGKVAGNLRASRYDADDTGSAMEAALKSLDDALDEAEEAAERAEQRAEQEKREELLAKYRGFLEREASIRASTERIAPTDASPLARRELIESRRLGTVQEELRQAIEALRAAEDDVRGSDALVEMHDSIDAALVDAKDRLGAGKPAEALGPVSDAIDGLAAIVAALDEENQKQDDDPFGDQQEGQQGQDGQQGGEGESGGTVPPAAEIKILRAMQESLAKRTRALAERADGLEAVARAQAIAELAARQQRILELAGKIADKIGPAGKGPETQPPTSEAPLERDGSNDDDGSPSEKPQSEGARR